MPTFLIICLVVLVLIAACSKRHQVRRRKARSLYRSALRRSRKLTPLEKARRVQRWINEPDDE